MYDLLLFDMGGVLVHFAGSDGLRNLLPGAEHETRRARFWAESPALTHFSLGRCSVQDFARSALRELGLSLPPNAFLEAFLDWCEGAYPGTFDLLEELQGRYVLGCLSNTNAFHWQLQRDGPAVTQYFTHVYASHEIGRLKPDPAAFQYVLDDTGLKPERVLYFDDIEENVAAARGVGMDAHRVVGPDQVRLVLHTVGVLPESTRQ